MPECGICGEEEFELRDGLFYCTTCSTQSQHFVEEELEEFTGPVPSTSYNLPKAKQAGPTPDSRPDKGVSWKLVEGFTIILREQVDALIKLGINPQIEDVVLKLWCSYMKKTGLGFTGQTQQETPENEPRGRFANVRVRDKYFMNPTLVKDTNVRASKESRKRGKSKTQEQREEQQSIMMAFGDEEFYEDDNPLNTDQRDPTMTDMLIDMEEGSQQQLLDKEGVSYQRWWRRHREYNPQVPVILDTLVFCYLGLQYTQSTVILNDIIRWVGADLLPYTDATKKFPESMKLKYNDWNVFCKAGAPTMVQLRRRCTMMARYLEIHPLPERTINTFLPRLILEMNLPGDLYQVVSGLHEVSPTSYQRFTQTMGGVRFTMPEYGRLAMAYIVLALKMLFGLDGEHEKLVCAFSERVKEIFGPDPDLEVFDWKAWQRHQNQKRFNKMDIKSTVSKGSHTISNAEDVSQQYETFCDTKIDHSASNEAKAHATADRIVKFLGQLSDKVGSSTENQKDSEKMSEDFTKQTILHISNWHGFLDHIETGGLSQHTHEQLHQEDQVSEGTPNPRTRFNDVASIALKAKEKWANQNILQQLQALDAPPKPGENYVLYKHVKPKDTQLMHESYHWLLQVASHYVGSTVYDLQGNVRLLELVLLKDKDNLTTKVNFEKKYFKKAYHSGKRIVRNVNEQETPT